MPEATGSTAAASAVFLTLADFAQRPVVEQAELKERVEALATAALAPLDPGHRVVLDTADGLAVVVLGSAEIALDLAERVLRKAHGLPLRVGINHGPVRLAGSRNDPQLVGDGLVVGAAVANFAQPGRLLVSRSFRDALSAVDPEMQSNVQLLKDRDWLDVAIVYNNGQRAILSMQKGPSGGRAFAEAFAAWKQ